MTDKKTDIFNSARELFYSKGYKETNVSEIANMAGIGVGTFYNYYSSKEQLFLEVYIKENEDLNHRQNVCRETIRSNRIKTYFKRIAQ